MKRIVQVLPACLIVMAAVTAGASDAPLFQVRAVLDAPTDASEPMTLVQTNTSLGRADKEVLNVEKKVLLDQSAVKSAKVMVGPMAGPSRIDITFTDEGRTLFAKITRQNIDKRLAFILDGRLWAAPVIRAEIPGGKFGVSGNFTRSEAVGFMKEINRR